MKIYLLSELQIEFEKFPMPEPDADVVVCAGDILVGDEGVAWAIESIPGKPVL